MRKIRFLPPISQEELLARRLRGEPVSRTHGELVDSEWNFHGNYFGPDLFGHGSAEIVYWVCPKGHKVASRICQKTRAVDQGSKFRGCPVCSGRTPVESQSLLATNPEIAQEWSVRDNGCSAKYVAADSRRLARFNCSACGHAFNTKVCARTAQSGSQGCPMCYVRSGAETISLADFPQLSSLFNRTSKNFGFSQHLLPVDHKVIWHCTLNDEHLVYESVHEFTSHGYRCRACRSKEGRQTLADSPELLAQFISADNGLGPEKLSLKSNVTVKWQCPVHESHRWGAPVFKRTQRKDGCPYCANRKVCETNCLANYSGIASEWHPVKNGSDKPESILFSSAALAWWLCSSCGREWQQTVRNRTQKNRPCPTCKNPVRGNMPKHSRSLSSENFQVPSEIAGAQLPSGQQTPEPFHAHQSASHNWPSDATSEHSGGPVDISADSDGNFSTFNPEVKNRE